MADIKIESLSFRYPDANAYALRDLSLEIGDGELCVVMGDTGSGKSTLLRCLSASLSPKGERCGRITLDGVDISSLSPADAAKKIGFVQQNPEHAIVTDKVYHELAFGLESIGASREQMHRRVAEVASYFGIDGLFERDTATLSGGQKQLLCLACAVSTSPELLILDEPTASLDPIAASELITAVKRLNADLGVTVIIVEHRLEELIPICDRLIVLEGGALRYNAPPRRVVEQMRSDGASESLVLALPTPTRLFLRHFPEKTDAAVPLSIKEARMLRLESCEEQRHGPITSRQDIAIELDKVYFRYEKDSPDILRGLSLRAYKGEIVCIVGGNGSGKSTMLSVIAGLERPYAGKVHILGNECFSRRRGLTCREDVGLVPQDVETLIIHDTVRRELSDATTWGNRLGLEPYYELNPYDLSGGQLQLLAFAKVLARRPRVLLLDEPTKGLDPQRKAMLGEVLRELARDGVCIVIVSHDVEFCDTVADRIGLFFRGELLPPQNNEDFFRSNTFYTTARRKILAPRQNQ